MTTYRIETDGYDLFSNIPADPVQGLFGDQPREFATREEAEKRLAVLQTTGDWDERPNYWIEEYTAEPSISPDMALVIVRCGDATATYEVYEGDAEYSASDTEQHPYTSDGCWYEPPSAVIEAARNMVEAQ